MVILFFYFRETEWLFGTPEGRASLQNSVGYDRLAIITMHRGHTYPSLEELQEELSECILQVAPAGHNRKVNISKCSFRDALFSTNKNINTVTRITLYYSVFIL